MKIITLTSLLIFSMFTVDPGLPPRLFPGDRITNNAGGFWTLPSGVYAIIEREPFTPIPGEPQCEGDPNAPTNTPCATDRLQIIDTNKGIIWTNRWHFRQCGDAECIAERFTGN